MKVLATRKKGLAGVYFLTIFIGLIALVCGIFAQKNSNEGIPLLIISLAIIITAICMIVDICKTPEIIITYDMDSGSLNVLGNRINIKDIQNVEYKNARAKHISYKFGTVFITANGNRIKCKYVTDCESVAKEIYKLSIEAKHFDL